MSIKSDAALNQAYTLIESGTLTQAKELLETALMADLDNKVLVFAVQCCSFWLEVFSVASQTDRFNRGEIITGEWARFRSFCDHSHEEMSKSSPDKSWEKDFERVTYAFKKGIYSIALDQYSNANDENEDSLKAQISRKKGLCYKKLGSYEIALNNLMDANSIVQNSAAIVAEMADCYALCGETKVAKVLFREAFYMNAQEIDLENLESPLITVLIDHVKGLTSISDSVSDTARHGNMQQGGLYGERRNGKSDTKNNIRAKSGSEQDKSSSASGTKKEMTLQQLKEWIPVYGVIMGIFSVKRELRSREVGKLKQEIYAKENELKNPANDASILTPKLLNMYFWLMDYYVMTKESVAKMNEVMLKIKILDQEVYRLYVK